MNDLEGQIAQDRLDETGALHNGMAALQWYNDEPLGEAKVSELMHILTLMYSIDEKKFGMFIEGIVYYNDMGEALNQYLKLLQKINE